MLSKGLNKEFTINFGLQMRYEDGKNPFWKCKAAAAAKEGG